MQLACRDITKWFSWACAAALVGCGGASAPGTVPQALASVAARAHTLAATGTVRGYDSSTGVLTLPGLAVADGSSTLCYDVALKTITSTPIQIELTSATGAACGGSTAGRYDAATGTLTVPALPVLGGASTRCYDVSLKTLSTAPIQLQLQSATEAACAGTPSGFKLSSPVLTDGGTLPAEYTCDGPGSTPALAWSGAPVGTQAYALLMTTLPGDGSTKWNWVLYKLPASTTALGKDSFGQGLAGQGSDGPLLGYQTPCSQGPGAKVYTFTVYALSAMPSLPASGNVTGPVLASAIAPVTLGSASLSVSYARTTSAGSSSACALVRNSTQASTTGQATVGCDATYAYVGANGLATHTMMNGITATNLQVPTAQNFFGANAWKIPLAPAIAANTTTAVDGPIGVAINGVPIFNPCKQGGCSGPGGGDTKVLGELDVCNGHAGRADDYHYHAAPVCLMAGKPASYWDTHPLGWALDGFAIFGYNNPDGSPAQRDAICGGNTTAMPNAPAGYSYHVTEASPYVLSCFRGTPSPDLAGQAAKYSPMRQPPVTPFAVSGMTLATDAEGWQVLSFSAARSFTTTETGADNYNNAPGSYRIRYRPVTGAALNTLLAQNANRNKSACWEFQFSNSAAVATQPNVSYCR